MLSKKKLFLLVLAASFNSLLAQQKIVNIPDSHLTFTAYPTPNLLQPTVGSAIIYTSGEKQKTAEDIAINLNKKGMPVFVLKNAATANNDVTKTLQFIQSHASEYQATTGKTGIICVGTNLPPQPGQLAFAALLAPPVKFVLPETKVPLLLCAPNTQSKPVIAAYSSFNKNGGHAELRLYENTLPDSIQSAEVMNWLSAAGMLKAISNEKTKERINADNWANFSKMIEERIHNDWAWIKRYESDNENLPAPINNEQRVVFMGNSITEGWRDKDPEFFKNHNYTNRGIGGQTTPQMLVRFREDVVNLHPKVVVILAGINDIAQNTGPSKLQDVAGNIISMAEIARENGIKVIFCSVLPSKGFPWHPGVDPIPSIISLNSMLKAYADAHKSVYVNYYDALVDEQKGFKKELTIDGVHPNLNGYKIMEPLVVAAINKTLGNK